MTGVWHVWPEVTAESRPWTRWWRLGSAVEEETITRLLCTYRDAGFGGVEITSIHGVQGEERNIDYLSPRWLATMRHAIAWADRLGMQVDVPPGSGWRIGGAFLDEEHSSHQITIETSGDEYRATIVPSGEQVKRPGRGGTGPAFNPFYHESVQAVFRHFHSAFHSLAIRAQFHDSWEYTANASPDLLEEFHRLRGYDVRNYMGEPAGDGGSARS